MSAVRPAVMFLVYGAAVVFSGSGAFSQTPAGGEFRLNSYTTGTQRGVRVVMDDRGDFVAIWSGDGLAARGLHGRRFDAAGWAQGPELLIATDNFAGRSAVASLQSGGFVVVWEGEDAQYNGIFARRYSRDGTALGGAFQVNTTTTGYQFLPSVAAAPGGGFLVVWSSPFQDGDSFAVVGRRFDASGAGGGEFIVNAASAGYQIWPRAAFAPDGRFAVAWQGYTGVSNKSDVFLRRFDASGAPLGPEFIVNTYRGGQQAIPALAFGRDGRFAVVWMGEEPTGGFDSWGTFGQRFAPSGAPLGAEFRAHEEGFGAQEQGEVAFDRNGGFLVAWYKIETPIEVSGRYFDPSGAPRGLEFRINTFTTGDQIEPAIASDPSGNFVVAWASGSYPPGTPQDGDRFGVYAQRFGGLQPAALAANAAGNGVFEPGETAVIAPSWRNVAWTGVSLGGTATSFTGPLPASYVLVDAAATYGTIGVFDTQSCTETGDCYTVSVSGARPATHWDAVLEESAGPAPDPQHGRSWRIHLGASFDDVPRESAFYRFVETVLHRGISAGCAATAFCPQAATTREQMSAMLLAARESASYRPPACNAQAPMFSDVPPASPFCPFVEELARRGVVSGCGGGAFCPSQATTREQMAVFVLRTQYPEWQPPPCTTPVFADVPASSPYCRWIEALYRLGVASGCGGGNYCPQAAVTREQMAVFLTTAFGLTLYGP
jgi:hypothetical protein